MQDGGNSVMKEWDSEKHVGGTLGSQEAEAHASEGLSAIQDNAKGAAGSVYPKGAQLVCYDPQQPSNRTATAACVPIGCLPEWPGSSHRSSLSSWTPQICHQSEA
jgi:hypothetical protein